MKDLDVAIKQKFGDEYLWPYILRYHPVNIITFSFQ